MKTTVLSLSLVCALFVSVPAAAQPIDLAQFDPQNWFKVACPTCGVHGYVDAPQAGATLIRHVTVIEGWGHECVSGAPVDRVDVWYEGESGRWVSLKQAEWALHVGVYARPDVAQAYRAVCPNVSSATGWWLELTNPPPVGARRVRFELWRGPYHAGVIRTYNVVE